MGHLLYTVDFGEIAGPNPSNHVQVFLQEPQPIPHIPRPAPLVFPFAVRLQ